MVKNISDVLFWGSHPLKEAHEDLLWNIIREIKIKWIEKIGNPGIWVTEYGYNTRDIDEFKIYRDLLKDVGNELNKHLSNDSDISTLKIILADTSMTMDINDNDLEKAARIFFYIIAPQQYYWNIWYKHYSSWMDTNSFRRLISMFKCIL